MTPSEAPATMMQKKKWKEKEKGCPTRDASCCLPTALVLDSPAHSAQQGGGSSVACAAGFAPPLQRQGHREGALSSSLLCSGSPGRSPSSPASHKQCEQRLKIARKEMAGHGRFAAAAFNWCSICPPLLL